jgi:ribose 5-phosphate isomerase B
MKIFIASDHAAYFQKKYLVQALSGLHQIIDLGPESEESVHYPDYAAKLCCELQKDSSALGILLCGSGIGVSMVANRFSGIRAALCRDIDDAKMAKEHNNANVICFGARKTPEDLMLQMTQTWLKTDFAGGRHQIRIDLFNRLGFTK